MSKNLEAFGEKLKRLREKAGFSREAMLERLDQIHHQYTRDGPISISPQLLWNWESAYSYKGRQWTPQRHYVLYLIELFAEQLHLKEAQEWAAQAGYTLTNSDLQDVFLPELDWPPAQAPQLPAWHVRRQQLEEVILRLIKEEQVQSLVLWGPGGIGKTTLATWITKLLAPDFPDGIIWVTCQPEDTAQDILGVIAESLGIASGSESPAKWARHLHSRLRKKQCLIVLDDIWSHSDLTYLRLGSRKSRLLCTTRDAKVAHILQASLIQVGGLTPEEGLNLLSHWAGQEVQAKELVSRVGGLPLALSLSGAQMRVGVALEELLMAFQEQQADLGVLDMDDPQTQAESLTLCFDLTYRCLPPVTQQRFAQLGYLATPYFQEFAIAALWGIDQKEARLTLRQLLRFALVERREEIYQLHMLLHDFAGHKLTSFKFDNMMAQRHTAWHIRYTLYHPGVLDYVTESAPDLDYSWPDVVKGVAWAAHHQPHLAAQAVLLAYTERSALVEAVGGRVMIQAIETYISQTSDLNEQVLYYELLGDIYLTQGEFQEGLIQFEQAHLLWSHIEEGLPASRTKLRMAGVCLLQNRPVEAAELAREAQTILEQCLPISDPDLDEARGLFYWFNMVYSPLVRWEGLPEQDVASLAHLAARTEQIILEARGVRIYSLWCLTPDVSRSPEIRQQGKELALRAYHLWRACGWIDQADDEISFSKYHLKGQYSRRTARRFARRRSQATPQISSSQLRLIKNESIFWWLGATEKQRIAWLSWMFPRYLAATNRPSHPVKGISLPALKSNSRAYRWVEDILNVGMLGGAGRHVVLDYQLPENHLLNGPEWLVLSGQKALSLEENRAKDLIESYLGSLESLIFAT